VLNPVRGQDPDRAGILHWEVLAPHDTALKQLAQWAAKAPISLAANALPEVKETTKEDNYLEPAEIESLLKSHLVQGNPEFWDKFVLETMHRRDFGAWVKGVLSQAKFAPTPAKDDLVDFRWCTEDPKVKAELDVERARLEASKYPITLKLDNARYPMGEAGTIDVELIRSGAGSEPDRVYAKGKLQLDAGKIGNKQIELVVQVPAIVDRLRLSSASIGVTSGDDSSADGELFKSLSQHRWRHLRLNHLNEWTPKGVETLVNRLHQEGSLPPEVTAKHLASTAWWGLEAVQPSENGALPADLVGKEVPVVGPPDGKKASIFDAGEMLPADAHIDNLHPVTATWLLKLLQANELCTLVQGWSLDEGPNKAKATPIFWTWVHRGSTVPVLGENVSAVVVSDGWGGDELKVKCVRQSPPADQGDVKPELAFEGARFSGGVFSRTEPIHFWGTWKLEVPGGSMKKQGGLDQRLEITIPTPELASNIHLEKIREGKREGCYRLQLFFTSYCPASLDGLLVFDYLKVQPHPDIPQSSHWLLTGDGQYIYGVRGGDLHVTPGLTFADFFRGYETAEAGISRQQLAVSLCKAAQALKETSIAPFTIEALSNDGLALTVNPGGALDVVQAAAGAAAARYGCSAAASDGKVVITAPEPSAPSWTRSKSCGVVRGNALVEDLFEYEGDLIRESRDGNWDRRVTPSFTLREYQSGFKARHKKENGAAAPMPPFGLSHDLALQVERARSGMVQALTKAGWTDKQIRKVSLTPRSLSADGKTVEIACKAQNAAQTAQAAQLFEAAARGLQYPPEDPQATRAFSDVKPVDGALALSTTRTGQVRAGTICCEFDPRNMFARVLADANPGENELVTVRANFISMNGRFADAFPTDTDGSTVPWNDAFETAEKIETGFSSVVKRLARPGYGEASFSMAAKHYLVVSVPLKGARADWVAAKPELYVGSKALGAVIRASETGSMLEGKLYVGPTKGVPSKYLKSSIKFEAKIKNPEAEFDGERVAIPDRVFTVDPKDPSEN
jgi:hypothetical protein